MKHHVKLNARLRRVFVPAAVVAAALGAAGITAHAEARYAQREGSFFVGGESKTVSPGNDVTINQMYVQYKRAGRDGEDEGDDGLVPVVLLHGCCLSGKTYETTPDGRMGWAEYFVRKNHSVYVPDQVSRARSGFDATVFSQVKAGTLPPSALPNVFQASHQTSWTLFRFGPAYNATFPDEQFPVEAADELYKQMIPDLNALLPVPNPTWTNLATLAVDLKGAVLMGHSESGFFPEQAALRDPTGVRGMITLEPGTCGNGTTPLTSQQIATLAKIPTLVVFGDHLGEGPFGTTWTNAFNSCQQYVQQITSAGGDATMMHLPDYKLHGNSHMMMQDRNNLQVADLLLKWIDQHVQHRKNRDRGQ